MYNMVSVSLVKFNGNKHLCRSDVILGNAALFVVLKWSNRLINLAEERCLFLCLGFMRRKVCIPVPGIYEKKYRILHGELLCFLSQVMVVHS